MTYVFIYNIIRYYKIEFASLLGGPRQMPHHKFDVSGANMCPSSLNTLHLIYFVSIPFCFISWFFCAAAISEEIVGFSIQMIPLLSNFYGINQCLLFFYPWALWSLSSKSIWANIHYLWVNSTLASSSHLPLRSLASPHHKALTLTPPFELTSTYSMDYKNVICISLPQQIVRRW